jgi:hypothetical protein
MGATAVGERFIPRLVAPKITPKIFGVRLSDVFIEKVE